MTRTVIFDLDGTLADTAADLIAAANACFRALGHGDLLTLETDASTALMGGRAMLRLGFGRLGRWTEDQVSAQYPLLLAAYAGDIDRHSRMYPGAVEALGVLQAQGYRLGICTNKPEALADVLLTRLGVRGYFAALVGADTLPVRKPDPAPLHEAVRRSGGDPARSLLIGDTATDRDTARAAGVPVLLVTFGPLGLSVADLAPDGLLHAYSDLPGLVGRLLP